jgi:hypothetical protein
MRVRLRASAPVWKKAGVSTVRAKNILNASGSSTQVILLTRRYVLVHDRHVALILRRLGQVQPSSAALMRQDVLLLSSSYDDPHEVACLEREFLTASLIKLTETHSNPPRICRGYSHGKFCDTCHASYSDGMVGAKLREEMDRMTADPLWQDSPDEDTSFDPLEFEARRALQ